MEVLERRVWHLLCRSAGPLLLILLIIADDTMSTQVQKLYTFMMDMVDYWADDDPEYGPKMRAAAKVLFPFYHYHDCWSGTHLEKRVTYSESKAYYPKDVEELRAWVEANPPVSDQAISDGFRAEQEEVMRELGEVGNPEIL